MSPCLQFTPGCSRILGDGAVFVPFGWDVQQEGAKQNESIRKGVLYVRAKCGQARGFPSCFVRATSGSVLAGLLVPGGHGLPCKGFGMSGAPLTCCLPCRNLIEPDQCTYNFTVSRIDVCLKKRQSQRWGGLEAPATRGLHPAFVSCLPAALQWGMGPPHHYQLPA